MVLTEDERLKRLEEKMVEVEKKATQNPYSTAPAAFAGLSPHLLPTMSMIHIPIWLAPPPPPPPPPEDGEKKGLDLKGLLGDLIGDRLPKSGGFGNNCKWITILVNWTEVPMSRTVTIAYAGSIKVANPGTASGGDLELKDGPGSCTIDVTLQPGAVLKIHIEKDGSSFGAWW